MGAGEVTQFLTARAVERKVAASTQNQALSALPFLYRAVLDIAERGPELRERLCKQSPDICAQLLYALEHELTETLTDFMLRRTGIGTSACMGKDCCEQIGRWMGEARDWDRRRLDREIQEYLDEIALGQRFREHSA